jgi:uncharacterized protein
MSSRLTYHRLPDAQFRSIASGYGDADALAELRSSQLSKRLLLLHWIRTMTDDEALAVIDSIGRDHPEAVRDVLALPFVDAWASSHGRHLESGRADDPHGGAYLAGIAAAIAVRAGVEVDLYVPAQPGQVVLPGVGLAYGLGAGSARIRCTPGRVVVVSHDRTVTAVLDDRADQIHWCPYRSVDLESTADPLTIVIDDLDPYRSGFGMKMHPRLRPAEADRLATQLVEAWTLLTEDHPGYARTVRECLRSIVPLAVPADGGSVSGTARRAFGAVAISPQRDGAALALQLIHETQHVKYNGVVDLVDLVKPGHAELFEAPWRSDPRPASALLTGAYAHTGVADFWRVRRTRTSGDPARVAAFEAAYWLEQTGRSLQTLAASDALTEPGSRFVDSLRATVEDWRTGPRETSVVDGVRDLAVAVSVGWRLRNHRTVDSDIQALVAAWHDGLPPPVLPQPVAREDTPPGPARVTGVADALRRRLNGSSTPQPSDPAERAHLRGDHTAAAGEFAARVRAGDDDAAWAGLALALAHSGRTAAAQVLRDRPELVRALYRRLDGADPERVAAWLASSRQV